MITGGGSADSQWWDYQRLPSVGPVAHTRDSEWQLNWMYRRYICVSCELPHPTMALESIPDSDGINSHRHLQWQLIHLVTLSRYRLVQDEVGLAMNPREISIENRTLALVCDLS